MVQMFRLQGYRSFGIWGFWCFRLCGWCFCSRIAGPFGSEKGSFRKLGVPYFGVLIIRILLFRVLYQGSPIFGNSNMSFSSSLDPRELLSLGFLAISSFYISVLWG